MAPGHSLSTWQCQEITAATLPNLSSRAFSRLSLSCSEPLVLFRRNKTVLVAALWSTAVSRDISLPPSQLISQQPGYIVVHLYIPLADTLSATRLCLTSQLCILH